jgi:hypothetical protein
MDQERLQGRSSQMDVRTLIKFHVCWVKVLSECYNSLKEGFETHVSSYETVHPWMNAIKNGREEADNAPSQYSTNNGAG